MFLYFFCALVFLPMSSTAGVAVRYIVIFCTVFRRVIRIVSHQTRPTPSQEDTYIRHTRATHPPPANRESNEKTNSQKSAARTCKICERRGKYDDEAGEQDGRPLPRAAVPTARLLDVKPGRGHGGRSERRRRRQGRPRAGVPVTRDGGGARTCGAGTTTRVLLYQLRVHATWHGHHGSCR